MLFLNAFFLGGLALASVPIIIHLLNRRRFQTVDWAPMKYLKLTIKTNRRRLRFEQLILLALRTLLIIALILAVARPLLSSGGAAWLPGHERTSRVIVIDNSLSTAYADAGRTALDAAKEAARQLIAGDSAHDTATVMTTADVEPLLREVPLDSPKVTEAVGSIAATDTRSDWPATFRQIDLALSTATFPSREVLLFTDLRHSGWADLSEIAARWAGQDVKLRIIDTGSRLTANLSLVTLEQEQRLALAGEPVRLRAQVRNDTQALVSGATAVFTVGSGGSRSERPVQLPDLPAGQTIDVPLTLTPSAAGQLAVRFTLPVDSLPGDNARDLILDVRPTLTIAMVDGQPSSKPFESATDFLSLAFSLGSTPWTISRMPDSEWNAGTAPAAVADAYVLADVAAPSAARIKELEQRVREGAALMIFAGDQIDQAAYNDRLYAAGRGLLPAKLSGIVEAPLTGLVVEPATDSPIAALANVAPAALARVQTRKILAVEPLAPAAEGLRVLARWNNAEASPAVIEKQFGRGTVLLWLQPADKSWGDWPLDPTYVLAVRSAVTGIVRDDAARSNVAVGPAIRVAAVGATGGTVRLPSGEIAPVTAIEQDLALSRTTAAGVYTFEWKDSKNRPQSKSIAAAPDRAESDLRPITDDALTAMLAPLTPAILHYTGAASLADHGREIWRTLATTALVLLVIEMGLATWVGRQR